MASRSLCPRRKSALDLSASSRRSKGERNGLRYEMVAAMVSAASVTAWSVTPKMAPSRMSLPMRTSTGRVLRWRPSAVSVSVLASALTVSASRLTSSLTARSTASGDGGSSSFSQTLAAVPGKPSALMRRTSCSRGTRCTSGAWCPFRMWSWRWRVKRCTATPSRTRPARPRRWRALARLTATSSSVAIRRAGSKAFSFMRPVSTTKPMSSIVTLVSQMLVAMITFVTPSGARRNTSRWSSGGTPLCNGKTHSRSVGEPNSRVPMSISWSV
mmetsp:Transcript_31138/g.101471  ORF Transcript_31138/g.101471 Transcript_31138/m.101471 type:complete len:271 (+) Transcript_31138:1053-1865(+)